MQVKDLGSQAAAGQSTPVRFDTTHSVLPFVVGNTAVLVLSTTSDFAGSVPQVQGSQDGTTYTNLLSNTEQGRLPSGKASVYMKEVEIAPYMRISLGTRTGGALAAYLLGSV